MIWILVQLSCHVFTFYLFAHMMSETGMQYYHWVFVLEKSELVFFKQSSWHFAGTKFELVFCSFAASYTKLNWNFVVAKSSQYFANCTKCQVNILVLEIWARFLVKINQCIILTQTVQHSKHSYLSVIWHQ